MNEHSFEGRVAVVTGAGRGIGRAYALPARRPGRERRRQRPRRLDATASAPTPDPAPTVAAEIVAAGGVAIADTNDVVDRPAGAQALVDAAVERFGRIDILVNNAGIMRWAGFPEADADNLERHLAVHVGGSFNTDARRVAAHGRAGLRPHRHDDVGRDVRPARTTSSYATAKGGVIGLTRSLATAGAAHGIKVNLIAPAAFTRMAGRRRRPDADATQMAPELVAPMVAFLAHEDCPVSGEIYAAGAGRFARIFIASTEGYVHDGPRRRSRTSPRTGPTINDEAGYTSRPTSWPGRPRSWPTCRLDRVRSRVAQLALEHLARRVPRERVDEHDVLRDLELRELAAAVLDELVGRRRRAGASRRRTRPAPRPSARRAGRRPRPRPPTSCS